jgi:hypothetical protein
VKEPRTIVSGTPPDGTEFRLLSCAAPDRFFKPYDPLAAFNRPNRRSPLHFS